MQRAAFHLTISSVGHEMDSFPPDGNRALQVGRARRESRSALANTLGPGPMSVTTYPARRVATVQ